MNFNIHQHSSTIILLVVSQPFLFTPSRAVLCQVAVFFTQQVSGPRVVPADVGPEPYEAHAAHDAGASRLDPAEFVTRRAAKPKRECWKGVGKGMKDHGNSMKY